MAVAPPGQGKPPADVGGDFRGNCQSVCPNRRGRGSAASSHLHPRQPQVALSVLFKDLFSIPRTWLTNCGASNGRVQASAVSAFQESTRKSISDRHSLGCKAF